MFKLSSSQAFIKQKGYPNWTQVTRVVEGAETPIFKQFFKEWPEAGGQRGMGQVKNGNIGKKKRTFFNGVNLITCNNFSDSMPIDCAVKREHATPFLVEIQSLLSERSLVEERQNFI